ncbi:putative per-hexamer repeat protein 5 [Liolophura sinensis]|uniref:putative per-hexamer repeat protein 5 n=1 Tax=Liolophura sinensis TaxID=3198878 RepID=UPI0031588555
MENTLAIFVKMAVIALSMLLASVTAATTMEIPDSVTSHSTTTMSTSGETDLTAMSTADAGHAGTDSNTIGMGYDTTDSSSTGHTGTDSNTTGMGYDTTDSSSTGHNGTGDMSSTNITTTNEPGNSTGSGTVSSSGAAIDSGASTDSGTGQTIMPTTTMDILTVGNASDGNMSGASTEGTGGEWHKREINKHGIT